MTENKSFVKLTANIPKDDMDFIEDVVGKGKFASRTDFTRDAIRGLRQRIEGVSS